MGYMEWIRTWEPAPRWEPWPDWDFMAERSTGLEPHRRSEPEPSVTLRCDLQAETFERDFLPTSASNHCSYDSADERTASAKDDSACNSAAASRIL